MGDALSVPFIVSWWEPLKLGLVSGYSVLARDAICFLRYLNLETNGIIYLECRECWEGIWPAFQANVMTKQRRFSSILTTNIVQLREMSWRVLLCFKTSVVNVSTFAASAAPDLARSSIKIADLPTLPVSPGDSSFLSFLRVSRRKSGISRFFWENPRWY